MIVLPEKLKTRWKKKPLLIKAWNELSDAHKEMMLDIYARLDAGTLSGKDAGDLIKAVLFDHEKEKYKKK